MDSYAKLLTVIPCVCRDKPEIAYTAQDKLGHSTFPRTYA